MQANSPVLVCVKSWGIRNGPTTFFKARALSTPCQLKWLFHVQTMPLNNQLTLGIDCRYDTCSKKLCLKNEVLVMLKVEMCALKSIALIYEKLLFP